MVRDGFNYFSFWAIFCPFTPLNSPRNQNFEKMKTMPGDVKSKLVVKSKLPPRSGCTLEAVEPHP